MRWKGDGLVGKENSLSEFLPSRFFNFADNNLNTIRKAPLARSISSINRRGYLRFSLQAFALFFSSRTPRSFINCVVQMRLPSPLFFSWTGLHNKIFKIHGETQKIRRLRLLSLSLETPLRKGDSQRAPKDDESERNYARGSNAGDEYEETSVSWKIFK